MATFSPWRRPKAFNLSTVGLAMTGRLSRGTRRLCSFADRTPAGPGLGPGCGDQALGVASGALGVSPAGGGASPFGASPDGAGLGCAGSDFGASLAGSPFEASALESAGGAPFDASEDGASLAASVFGVSPAG